MLLQAAALACERGGRTVFRGLAFEAREGELLRIAGANGAGKTSLLRILCGLLLPAEGEVRFRGEPIGALKEDYSRSLVYLGHAPAVKDDLTAVENLAFACRLAGQPADAAAIDAALERYGVPAGRPVRTFSQGQRRRAALSRLCLAAAAPLWLLDEPFVALDAASTRLTEALIAGHVAGGGVVLYATHQEDRLGARVLELEGAGG